MTETSTRITFTEMVNASGPMAESTMVNGLTTKWRAKVPSLGVTVVHISVNTRMTRSTDKVHSNGQMVESTSESGLKESNTVKVLT